MYNKHVILGLAAALIAAPVAAADSAQAVDVAKPKAAKENKYCMAEAMTGTRMATKVCKTKADWDKDGVDITAETSKK